MVKANSALSVLLKMSTDSTKTDSAFRADTAAASKSVASKEALAAKNQPAKNEPAKGKTDSSELKLLKQSGKDTKTSAAKKMRESEIKGPLFSKLISLGQNNPGQDIYGQGAMVGRASINDTAEINHLM